MSIDGWPTKGDKPFISAKDGVRFSISSIDCLFPAHAKAYKRAADILLDKCIADGDEPRNDILIFPVLFLYRHYIELNLKMIIDVGIKWDFFRKEDVEKDRTGHNLAKLWNHAQKLLIDRWPGADQKPLKATETVINEIHQADPNSQVFRYDTNTDGQQHRCKKLPDNISISKLKNTMDGVFNFLETTWSVLEGDLQNVREVQDRYRE
jgi:hypothetical protein